MPAVNPIPLPSSLAGTPAQNPQYSAILRLKSGEEIKVADPRATRALVSLMDMQAVLGGAASHWGGPSAFAELMSVSHALMFHESQKQGKPWYELFHFVNDAGHCENGLYALKANYGFADLTIEKLKGFRSIDSYLTGHGESHLFPEGVLLSNGPLGSSLPQAQGLAFADALAGRTRTTLTAISDGGCMEGEAKEALAAIPGLAAHGKMAPFVLIISDNNTKLSGRIDVDSFSMAGTFASLKDQGWHTIHLENGNDLQACAEALEAALKISQKNPKQPVAIHARTVKGFGVKKTTESSSGGHGFPLKSASELKDFIDEIYEGKDVPVEFSQWMNDLIAQESAPSSSGSSVKTESVKTESVKKEPVKKEKVQAGVASAMIRKKKEGLPIVSISADLPGSTGVASFQKEFPESSQDVGVAESNMISMSAGLSKMGFIPVVDTFAQFGVTKGALPLTMASLSQAPVIAIFSHAGFQDAADGASHQALSYFAKTCAIPHTDVYCLTSRDEADALVGQALEEFYRMRKEGNVPNTSIFFLGRETFPETFVSKNDSYKLKKAQIVWDNSEELDNAVTIVAAGPLLAQALEAARTLKDAGQGCVVVNPSIINKPDLETIAAVLKKTDGRLVTVEDHQQVGGMSAILLQALASKGICVNKIECLAVKGEFGQSAYKATELYKKHGLDARSIFKAAQRFVE